MKRTLRRTGVLLLVASIAGAAPAAQAEEEKPPFIEKIEELMGIPVTFAQREAIAEASQEMLRALRERQRAFVAGLRERGTIPTLAEKALTPVDGLPFGFDKEALAVIAAHAAEPPTQMERDTIRYLDEEKARDFGLIREQYAVTLSGITDLPAFMIMELLEPAGTQEEEAEGAVRFPPE